LHVKSITIFIINLSTLTSTLTSIIFTYVIFHCCILRRVLKMQNIIMYYGIYAKTQKNPVTLINAGKRSFRSYASVPSVPYLALICPVSVKEDVDKIIRYSSVPASRGHLIVFFRKFRRRLSSWQTTPLLSSPAHLVLFSRRSQKVFEITSEENDARFLRWASVQAITFFREHRHHNFHGIDLIPINVMPFNRRPFKILLLYIEIVTAARKVIQCWYSW